MDPAGCLRVVCALVACALVGCSPPLDSQSPATQPPVASTVPLSPPPAPTHTAIPAPSPTATLAPTPTPSAGELLSEADRQFHNGDYLAAAETYLTLLQTSSVEETAGRAYLGLATAYSRDGEYSDAVGVLGEFLLAQPESPRLGDAHFLRAEALLGAGDPLAAAEQYRLALSAGTIITGHINKSIGDALHAGAAYEAAIRAYEESLAAAPDLPSEVEVRERLALTHVGLRDYSAAIAEYDAILSVARIRAYRARIEYQAAETLILSGDFEAGYERHARVVETYPDEEYAYHSLVVLAEAGWSVGDLLRGIVDYRGEAYAPAVVALHRYVHNYPDTHSGDAHWYAGLSYLATGSPSQAAAEFNLLIDTHPKNRHQGDAWMGLAEAHVDAGDLDLAVATYQQFAGSSPDHARAPEALWRAARLLERSGDPSTGESRELLRAAAEAYLNCQLTYPESEYASEALFRAGLQFHRLGEPEDAKAMWQTLPQAYRESSHGAAALFWLGKLYLDEGDAATAEAALRKAAIADPTGYYGLRATDLLDDPLSMPFQQAESGQSNYDRTTAQLEAEEWLAEWLALDGVSQVREFPLTLAADQRLLRGLELWRLGRLEDARHELEALRNATASDALIQYHLALQFRDIGLYRSSILCAVRVVHLSPAATVLDVPESIARLAYPTYFDDLVQESASEHGLDPLLVFSLIRQESLFESLAMSSASAHGLMQVIPPTGAQIASELDWPPDYETNDLYRPYVSVRFGTYYLSRQRDRFGGGLHVALAGYNGGPLNAQHWLEMAGDDPDLFLELITFAETREYVRALKEHYAIYRALYGGGWR